MLGWFGISRHYKLALRTKYSAISLNSFGRGTYVWVNRSWFGSSGS